MKRLSFLWRTAAAAALPVLPQAVAKVEPVVAEVTPPVGLSGWPGLWLRFVLPDGTRWTGAFSAKFVDAERLASLRPVGVQFVEWMQYDRVIHIEPLESAIRSYSYGNGLP
jgi:hypothetical protein